VLYATSRLDASHHLEETTSPQTNDNSTSDQRHIMSEATPRITAPYLEQFSHQTVRILGKVRQIRGEQATIDAGGQVSVFLNRVSLKKENNTFTERKR
jgi:mevalonate pyrophosphate decarboxylase